MASVHHVQAEMTARGAQIAEARREFVQGILSWLSANYRGQHVHVWVNGQYLGLYMWGLAMHWRWGATDVSREELKAAIASARTVNLASEKPLPLYSGLDAATDSLAYYSA